MTFALTGLAGQIGNELLARGYAPHTAAAILGNIQQESAFNPAAVGDNGNAYGLVQWNGPRRRAYLAFARDREAAPDDWQTQLDFLEHEFKGPEARAFRQFSALEDAGEAAGIASDAFWRPGVPHRDRRIANAQRFMEAYRPEDRTMGMTIGTPQRAPLTLEEIAAQVPAQRAPLTLEEIAAQFTAKPRSTFADHLGLIGERLSAYGQGRPANLAPMREAIRQTETENSTVRWLANSGRTDLAEAVQTGAMNPLEAVGVVFQQQQGRERRYNVGGQLVDANGTVVFDGAARERADRARTSNRTVEWLREYGRDDLASAMEAGAIEPLQAVSVAMDGRKTERIKGQSPAGQIMADVENGLISREQAEAELARLRSRQGSSFEVGPDGTVRYSETGFAGTSGSPDRLARALSSADAAFIKGIREKADGTKVFGLLNAAESLIDTYETGATAGITGTIDRFGAAIGLTDGEEATQFEQLEAVSKSLAMEGLKMLGGNDTERELLTSMQTTVRPTNRPETNRAILKRQRAALEIASERADFYSRWATTPKTDESVGLSSIDAEGRGVEQAWRAYQRQRWDALIGSDPDDGTPLGAPAAGHVEDGHRFKGGDPSEQANWEKL